MAKNEINDKRALKRIVEEYKKLLDDVNATEEEINKNIEKQIKARQKLVDNNKLIRVISEEIEKEKAKGVNKTKEQVELEEELLEIQKNTEILVGARLEQAEETNKKQREQLENYKKANKAIKDTNVAINTGAKAMEKFLGSFGINNQWDDSFLGQMETAIVDNRLGDHTSQMLAKLSELPQMIGGSAMMKVGRSTMELALAQDTATAALSKATGAGDKYDGKIQDVYMSNRRFGASFQDAGEAISSMYSTVPAFDDFSSGTRDGLLETSILLDKLGISSDTTAGIISHMTTTMGMSGEQALRQVKDLSKLSGTGMDLKKVYSEYMKVSDRLSSYSGPKSIEVFSKLSRVAKATASDVGELLTVAESFDTFDDAAEAAGRFNALLGGNFVDPVALINMEDMGDRVNYIVGLKDKAGLMWETMSRYERLSIAKSLNMDVQQLGKLWGMSSSSLAQYNEEQETLAERAKEAADVQEKWNSVQQTFAIAMGPLIDNLAKLADWYLELDKGQQAWTSTLGLGGAGIMFMVSPVLKLIGFLGKITGSSKLAQAAISTVGTTAGTTAASGITAVGAASEKAGPGLMKLGIFALEIGGAFALAGLGMLGFGTGVSKIFDSIATEKVEALGKLFLYASGFGPAALIAVPATIAFTAALAGLSAVIRTFDEDKLANITQLSSNFSDIKKDNVEVYTRAAQETTKMYKAAKESGGASPMSAASSAAPTPKVSVPFIIKLDEREMGNFVVEIVDNRIDILSRE